MSREKQDEWKRTQVRMPQDQYEDVTKYAVQHSFSLNSALLDLINKGLEFDKKFDSSKFDEEADIDFEIREYLKKINQLLEEKEFLKSIDQVNEKLRNSK